MEEKKTCLYDKHVALGALMSPFGGFIMPIQYSSITDEHMAVRQHCGVFDVSHMGEVRVTGPDAERYVNHIFTNDVTDAPQFKIYYGMMCYPNGGTVDDLLVYKMAENDFFIVINAANSGLCKGPRLKPWWRKCWACPARNWCSTPSRPSRPTAKHSL